MGAKKGTKGAVFPGPQLWAGGGGISNDSQLATNILIHTYLQTSAGCTSYAHLTLPNRVFKTQEA